MDGVAAVGVSLLYARQDHVHPIDTSRAPLNSPAFTGVPTAPTAAPGDSTTEIATTAFVTTADNLKANIASPTFTGTPAAPTAGAGTNTTQLATTAFVGTANNFLQSGTGATTRTMQDKARDFVSVKDFGAVGDGSTDDTTAIQNAIDSLPNGGGIVLFPVGNYRITSTLTVGNGTASVVSTKRGVILRGMGVPNTPTGVPSLNGYTDTTGPKITWAGAASTSMVVFQGPLQGWGVQNLFLDGASITGVTGLGVSSAQFGDSSNLTIQNCFTGIFSTTNPLGGYTGVGNVDCLRNNWTNISVLVPALTGAKGILLTGDAGGTSNTDYNTFTNTFIRSPAAATNFGLYLGVCDSNSFHNIAISMAGGTAIEFDYSISSNFPLSNNFYSYECGAATPYAVLGSPGGAATPNRFYGWIQANSATAPTVTNTEAAEGPWIAYTPTLTAGAGTFTTASATGRYKQIGKTVHFRVQITITTVGTGTLPVFTLPVTPFEIANVVVHGNDRGVSGKAVTGRSAGGATTIGVTFYDGTNPSVNGAIFGLSGVFEAA